MRLSPEQQAVKARIEAGAALFGLDPDWCLAVAMTESSLGLYQRSKTGCVGVFQMSSIAMKDLLRSMAERDDEAIDIAVGLSFLALLVRRWKTPEEATRHFCDPKDLAFYPDRVARYQAAFKAERRT